MRFSVKGRDAGVWMAGGKGEDAGWRGSVREGGGEGGWRGACCSAHDLLLWAPLVMAGWCRGAELSLSSCKHWSALQHHPLHHHLHLHHQPPLSHPHYHPHHPLPSISPQTSLYCGKYPEIANVAAATGGWQGTAGGGRRLAQGRHHPPETPHKKNGAQNLHIISPSKCTSLTLASVLVMVLRLAVIPFIFPFHAGLSAVAFPGAGGEPRPPVSLWAVERAAHQPITDTRRDPS